MIDNDINHLKEQTRIKVQGFLDEAKANGLNIKIFEGLRTLTRQKELYCIGRTKQVDCKPVTWTLSSNHLTGQAVDIVFVDNGKVSWNGDYNKLIEIGKKWGLNNLAPRETCHFEDNGLPLNNEKDVMSGLVKILGNSYDKITNSNVQTKIKELATLIRSEYKIG